MMRRDTSSVQRLAEQLIKLSREGGLQQYHSIGRIMGAWARAHSGAVEDGLVELRAAISAHRANATVLVSFFSVTLAETELLGGHIDGAASALAVAIDMQKYERVWASDIARVSGDLCLLQDRVDLQSAEQMYNEALSIARAQNARSLELRTALRLARLQGRQGRLQEGIDLIKPLYSWFSEGLDTPDLKEAREFLERAASSTSSTMQ
jgi:predicted negative regulator of RcsB-dependent stress response